MVRNNAPFHRRCLVHSVHLRFEELPTVAQFFDFRLSRGLPISWLFSCTSWAVCRASSNFCWLKRSMTVTSARSGTPQIHCQLWRGILAQGHCKPTCLIISLHPRRPKQTSLSSLGHDRYLLILYIHWHPLAAVGSCLCLLTSHKCLPRGVA